MVTAVQVVVPLVLTYMRSFVVEPSVRKYRLPLAALSVAGNITGGNILSSAVVSAVGNATILSGTAVPAGGTTGAGYKLSSTANLGVFFGSGVPTLSAAKGSLYLRTDGSTTNDRMYVNTNGTTTWTAVTTVA